VVEPYRSIKVRESTYQKLSELGNLKSSFDSVISELVTQHKILDFGKSGDRK